MNRHLAVMTAGFTAVVGLLVGLVLAGNLSPSKAQSAERRAATIGAPPGPVLRSAPTPGAGAPPSFADIADRVNPSVVTVNASARGDEGPLRRSPGDGSVDPFFRGPDRERRGPRRGAGTGFIVDAEGLLVTNHHVVEGAERISVRLASGQTVPAELVGSDPETDIALLRLRGNTRLPPVSLGDSDRVRVGEWVVAIGNPLAYEHTVTVGVVSFIGRKLFDSSLDRYIQTDAAINLGNSGGPLINTVGEVIGINAAVSSRAPTIGFAIPINQAKAILPQLRDNGRVSRGYAGVAVRDLDPDLRRALGLSSQTGAVVQDVTPSSPAERAGIRPYDVVVALDRLAVASGDDLIMRVAGHRPGDTVALDVVRDGRAWSTIVKLAERPSESRPAGARTPSRPSVLSPRLGLSVRELDANMAARLGVPSDVRGVIVWRVDTVSAAVEADIERGDVILEVDRQPVTSVQEYQRRVAAAKPGDVLTLYLYKSLSSQRRLSTIRVD